MVLAWLGITLLVAQNDSGPLTPLAPFLEALDSDATRFAGGEDPGTAFRLWAPGKSPESRLSVIREGLKKDGVSRLKSAFLEYEILFIRDDNCHRHLRCQLWLLGETPSLLDMHSNACVNPKKCVRGLSSAHVKGTEEGLVSAGRALLKRIESQGSAGVPVPDDKEMGKYTGRRIPEDVLEAQREKRTQRIKAACEAVKGIEVDDIRVRINDHAFFGFDREGKPRASISGDFDDEEGKLSYYLKFYQSLGEE